MFATGLTCVFSPQPVGRAMADDAGGMKGDGQTGTAANSTLA
jgi:hypothetical protein